MKDKGENVIENITPFLASVETVRAVIQESIDMHPVESFRRYPHGDLTSLRKKTTETIGGCADNAGNVYLPDEVSPVAMTKQFMSEQAYTITEDIVLAVICRTMMGPINDLYSAAAGGAISVPFRLSALEGKTKKQVKEITAKYLKKVESRKDCKMLRARPYKTASGEKINHD